MSEKKYKVVITDADENFFEPEKEVLEPLGVDLQIFDVKSADELYELAPDADIILTTYVKFDREAMQKFKNLKLISRHGAGYDNIDVRAATELGIIVCNIPEYGRDQVADHAMTLLLTLIRRVRELDELVRNGGWFDYVRERWSIPCMQEMTLGVIGTGKIGSKVVKKAQPFFARILVYDPYIPGRVFKALDKVEAVDFETLLRESDAITIHTPLTREGESEYPTYHMINDKAFEKMKDGVIIVNTARGPVIDTDALVRALESGKVSAAGLDVHETEPLPEDHPIRKFKNVILTPHAAWYTNYSIYDMKRKWAENAARFIKGEELQNVVNPEVLEKIKR
ncbi:MAG: D-3-phosphoglycerate dehydrogenase / 2-oxoglutarate reductase [Archaeoglobi archaeon]|nr:D-3-phosphoglycerate dehydrogenase / 2-oxoglutarate reductase [Archaeoglobi archaeon]